MADAIVPQTDRRTSVEVQLAPLTTGRVAIKREAGEEEAEVGSPLRQKLDRRENTTPPEPMQGNQSTTSRAISALIDQTSTANRRASSNFGAKTLDELASESAEASAPKESAVKDEANEEDKLAIFDFTEALPVDSTRPRTDLAKVARNARRHSSVPALVNSESEKPEGTLPSLHKRTGSGTIKNVSTSLAKSTTAARLNAKKASVPVAAGSKDGAAGDADKASATSSLRAERIASRRKSMLL